MGKSIINMAIFNSYVKLPEGKWILDDEQFKVLEQPPQFFGIRWVLGFMEFRWFYITIVKK